MDRLIALLAALVGLISLGGALLVHNNGTAIMTRQAGEIAQLKASLTLLNQQSPAALSARPEAAPARNGDDGTADALLALQSRIVTLEQLTREQANALEATRVAMAENPGAAAPVAALAASEAPPQGATPAALAADGPTTDCIPLGTRFMAQSGDSFPICKTKAVVAVSSVSEGSAIVDGAGAIVAGGFASLPVQGCTVMVFTADLTGFAELRVTCV